MNRATKALLAAAPAMALAATLAACDQGYVTSATTEHSVTISGPVLSKTALAATTSPSLYPEVRTTCRTATPFAVCGQVTVAEQTYEEVIPACYELVVGGSSGGSVCVTERQYDDAVVGQTFSTTSSDLTLVGGGS